MPAVKYVGHFEAVDALGLSFAKDAPVEVDNETAEALVFRGGGLYEFADPKAGYKALGLTLPSPDPVASAPVIDEPASEA